MKHTRILKIASVAAFALTLLLSTGCQSTPTAASSSPASTTNGAGTNQSALTLSTKALQNAANTSWILDQWTSSDGTVHLPALITLRLGENGRVSGSSGENAYFGTTVLEADGSLNWNRALAATRILGSPETIKREAAYIADLKATKQVELKRNRLIFIGENALRLEFVPAPTE